MTLNLHFSAPKPLSLGLCIIMISTLSVIKYGRSFLIMPTTVCYPRCERQLFKFILSALRATLPARRPWCSLVCWVYCNVTDLIVAQRCSNSAAGQFLCANHNAKRTIKLIAKRSVVIFYVFWIIRNIVYCQNDKCICNAKSNARMNQMTSGYR